MSFSQKSRAVMENWDKEEFKKIHHPDYMFIRETELVTLDDWADRMEKWVVSGNFGKDTKDRLPLPIAVRLHVHFHALTMFCVVLLYPC